jgi:hypothetical protein
MSRQAQQLRTTAGQYAHALIKGDEDTLNKMTVYSSKGGVGSSPASLPSSATGISEIMTRGNDAIVFFEGTDQDTPCVGRFTVLGNKVLSDWKLYKQI